MAEGRDLVQDAMRDAKSLREAAVERAKTDLVESLAPAVRRLLDEQLAGALSERGRTGGSEWEKSPEGGTRQQKKDYGKLATQESAEPVLEDALQEFFPAKQESTMPDVNEKKSSEKSSKKSSIKEAFPPVSKKSSKKSSMSETIEISEAELRKVYEAALQTEVQVKKGFGDMSDFVELGGKTPDNDKTAPPPPTGKSGGEKHWREAEPPAKKDAPKENKPE